MLKREALDSVQGVPGSNPATATDNKCTGGKRVLHVTRTAKTTTNINSPVNRPKAPSSGL